MRRDPVTGELHRIEYKQRGVSKKERRRRKAALIEAIDAVDKSPEEALQALKNEMTIQGESNATSQETAAEED